jgi:hypothetical protein
MSPPQHQQLFVCVDGPVTARDVATVRDVFQELSTLTWARQPPQLVDEVDEEESRREGDVEARNTGIVLVLPGPSSDRETESSALNETVALLDAFERCAARTGCEFAVDLNGENIGNIDRAGMSRDLHEGLLNPWRAAIEALPR